MKTSEMIQDLSKAMSLMQGQIKPAIRDCVNSHFKSKYANIESVWEAIRDPMTANGLTVWQDLTTEEKSVSVTTRVVHSSGQWVEFGPLKVPLSKMDAHGVGSASSYAKRYSLCAALGVVSGDEDDDANAAVSKSKSEPEPLGEPARVAGFDDFEKRYNLQDENSLERKYIINVMIKSKKDYIPLINICVKNENEFIENFTKWKEQNKAT